MGDVTRLVLVSGESVDDLVIQLPNIGRFEVIILEPSESPRT